MTPDLPVGGDAPGAVEGAGSERLVAPPAGIPLERIGQVPGLRFDDAGPAATPRDEVVARAIDYYVDDDERRGGPTLRPRWRPPVEVVDARTRAELRRLEADVTPADLVQLGAVAEGPADVEHVAYLSLALFGHRETRRRVTLPGGRVVASLHAHIAGWRHRGLVGFTDQETPGSRLAAANNPPLEAPRD